MNYIDSATRSKHAFIDKSLANTRECLALSEVQQALGEVASRRTIDIIESMYVPNTRNGRIELNEDQLASDDLPIFALGSDERIRIPTQESRTTDTQVASISKFMNENVLPGASYSDVYDSIRKFVDSPQFGYRIAKHTLGAAAYVQKTHTSDISCSTDEKSDLLLNMLGRILFYKWSLKHRVA